MRNSDLFSSISMFIMAIGVVGGLSYWWILQKSTPPTIISLVTDNRCQPLGHPCLAKAPTFSLSFALPSTLVPLRPFEVSVITQGVDPKQMFVDFIMPGMTMPPNQITLIPSNQANRWIGKAILPLCSSGQSTWIATLELIDRQNNIYRGQLPFLIQTLPEKSLGQKVIGF